MQMRGIMQNFLRITEQKKDLQILKYCRMVGVNIYLLSIFYKLNLVIFQYS